MAVHDEWLEVGAVEGDGGEVAVHQPAAALDRLVGRRVFLKGENQQRTGSFKFRGAYHAVQRLRASRPRLPGVIATTAGNHARALAVAARMAGVRATVVMPSAVSRIKVQAAALQGAEVVTYGPKERGGGGEAIVARRARIHGLAVVSPADSVPVVAGAGTVAWELCRQTPALGTLLVPVGGGALAAGCAVAAHAHDRHTKVIGVEPEAADDTRRSFDVGRRTLVGSASTAADELRHARPDALPFTLLQQRLADVVTVSEQPIADAMALLYVHLRTIVEPSGAVALAALLTPGARIPRGLVGVVLTGGNVSWEDYRTVMDPAMVRSAPDQVVRSTDSDTLSG